jgi:hypothetical protein
MARLPSQQAVPFPIDATDAPRMKTNDAPV